MNIIQGQPAAINTGNLQKPTNSDEKAKQVVV